MRTMSKVYANVVVSGFVYILMDLYRLERLLKTRTMDELSTKPGGYYFSR